MHADGRCWFAFILTLFKKVLVAVWFFVGSIIISLPVTEGKKIKLETNQLKRPFQCSNNCGRFYTRCNNMKKHVKFECGKSPSFGCLQCPYRPYYEINLKTHILKTHSPAGETNENANNPLPVTADHQPIRCLPVSVLMPNPNGIK